MKQIDGSELRHIGHPARNVRRDPVNPLFASSAAWATTTLGEIADIRNGATPNTRISAIHAVKQGMMQQLLTGKIRLVDTA